MSDEESLRDAKRFAAVIIALRGLVDTEELLEWAAKVYLFEITPEQVAELTLVIPRDSLLAYFRVGVTSYELVRGLHDSGIDPSIAESMLS